jgi:RNA polymerase sigma factor (sigma-70 family)
MPLEALIINQETPIEGIRMDAVSPTANLEPHVRAAAQGDPEAFARLVDATRTLVCSIALAILRDVEASQDVAQDVFLAAWRELGKLRNPASFLPWLRQMTRNRAHHVLRGRVRLRRVISDAEADDMLAAASDPRPGSPDRLLAAEEERLLAEALDELSDDAREVVTLYYREGRSVRQVADLLGLREEAVKQRLSRARSRLRETMLDRLGTALQRTAPGAAFTAAVMTALSLSAPATATAAGIAASAKLSAVGPWAKLAALLGGAGLGVAGGIAGILLGTRRYFARARDDQERRGLRLYVTAAVALVLVATWGMVASRHSLWGTVLSVLAFDGGLLALIFGWLPRVTARRRAAEIAADPAALRRYQRERRRQILIAVLALLATGALMIWPLLQRGS